VVTGFYASFKIEEKLADSLVFQDGSIEHISPPSPNGWSLVNANKEMMSRENYFS
jgi:hypothetical protein